MEKKSKTEKGSAGKTRGTKPTMGAPPAPAPGARVASPPVLSSPPVPAEPEAPGRSRDVLDEFFAAPEEVVHGGVSLEARDGGNEASRGALDAHEYLTFRLAEENFGLSILHIKEIIKPPLITPVPRTQEVILGILSLRGTVVPVVDLRRRLGLDAGPQTRKTRILIVQMESDLIGLLVDEVRHVIRLRESDIEPPPAVFGRVEVEHLRGVGRQEGEMYTLLDVASVVQIERYLYLRPQEVIRG